MYDDDPIQGAEDAEECAANFGERFNMEPAALLTDRFALVEAGARWEIRGDDDAEAGMWLSELVRFQRIDPTRYSRGVAHVVVSELLPMVDALACSTAWPAAAA